MSTLGVALVTGASRGIGADVARRLATDGYDVACAATSAANAAAVAEEITNDGTRRAIPIEARVQDPASVERAVDEIENTLGPITLLVNNAGINRLGPVHELSVEDFDAVIDVNLVGVWRGMRAAIPIMREQGAGSIVNMSSVQALVGFAGWAGYAASKGGINSLTQQAAVEYAPDGIRVNAIVPGTILTEMNERIMQDSGDPDRQMDEWVAMHPMRRVGMPAEVHPVSRSARKQVTPPFAPFSLSWVAAVPL